MNLILHSDTATFFESNGIGVLTDAIASKVVREINGQYELTLKYPDTGIWAEFITDRYIIMAKPDPVTDPQPFRIYRVNPVSKGTITAYARHIAYDTMGIPCAPFSAYSCADAVRSIPIYAATDCPFTFSTDKTTGGNLSVSVPKSIWGIMGGTEGSILDTYGGEYDFDRYHISLMNRLGADRGVSIRYGKNLTTLEQDRNCANVYTGVFPYWKSYEGDVVMLPEQIINAAGTYNFTRILPLDLSEKFEEAPTIEQLREAATDYMASNSVGVPDISWTVQFVQLEQTEEYKGIALLEQVQLGDTVSVIFPRMNVNASARAVKIDFDPILERYNSVTLGRIKSDIASTIVSNSRELKKEVEKRTGVDALNRVSEIAAKAILGAKGGIIRMLDTDDDGNLDTLYIADHNAPDKARKVWRWNYEGWAASSNGYNGPFQMAATLEAGLLSDFITAAHLTSGTIESRDGTLFIDLDNGIIRSDSIMTEVNKKVGTDELSTKIQQSASDVQIAWNKIDYRIKFEEGELRIYNGTHKVAAYTMTGAKYYKNGLHVGTIGTNQSLAGNTSLNGLSFNLEQNGNFMAWIKDNLPALTWYRGDSTINGETHNSGFHAYDDFYFHNSLKFHGGGYIFNAEGGGTEANIYIYSGTLHARDVLTSDVRWMSWAEKTYFVHKIDPAGGISGYSDARLKDNISDSEVDALSVICGMELKQFDRLDNGRHFDIGLIAQQLQEIAPELVGTDSDGLLYIQDEKLVYYAFKAIQELAQAVWSLMGIETFSERKAGWVDTYTREEKELAVAKYTRAKEKPMS